MRLPEQDRYLLTEIPAVTEVVRFTGYADGARTSVYVWFGYVPGSADAGLAVCDVVQGGVYDGFASCRPGSLNAGPARLTGNYASAAWTGQPVGPPQPGLFTEPSSTSKEIWYGWAPADAARVTIRFGDGRQYSGHTVPGWPHSGLSLWGPITVQSLTSPLSSTFDTVVITYDASGQVLQRTPLVFLGPGY